MTQSNIIKHINIIGSGSMGHLWSAYLSKFSIQNQVFTKKLPLNKTVSLSSPKESFKFNPNYKLMSQWTKPAFTIIAVKAQDLESVCIQLKSITKKHTPIILMMNGLGLLELVKQYLPETDVYHASTTHAAKKEIIQGSDTITIHHTGFGETYIGESNDNKSQPNHTLSAGISVLNRALPLTSWHFKQKNILWLKLLINSVINPLTSIHNIKNGEIVSNSAIYLQAKKLTQQLEPIILHYLPHETWQSVFKKIELIAYNTAENSSSMREDIIAKRQTEINYITGYLLSKARELQINLPDHQLIMKQVKELENNTSN